MWKRIPRKKARKSPEEALAIKKLILRLTFFLGWILSPLTFWNDAFVNIPIAYICANLFIRVWPVNFLGTVLVFYWLSNGLGILMMYLSGKNLLTGKKDIAREILKLIAALAIYSFLIILLHRVGILKPV